MMRYSDGELETVACPRKSKEPHIYRFVQGVLDATFGFTSSAEQAGGGL